MSTPGGKPAWVSHEDWLRLKSCNNYRRNQGLPELGIKEYLADHKGKQGCREFGFNRGPKPPPPKPRRVQLPDCKADAIAIAVRNREIVERKLGIKLPAYK